MGKEWKYQIRIYLDEPLADVARRTPGDNGLEPLADVLANLSETLSGCVSRTS